MITILSALPDETREIVALVTERETTQWSGGEIIRGNINRVPVLVAQCGVGKVLAAMMTQQLITAFGCSRLIFSGLAGALDHTLVRGDIVLADSVIQHDMDVRGLGFQRGEIPYTGILALEAAQHLNQAITQAGHEIANVVVGRILTGDQFVAADRPDHLHTEFKGIAVDMESASVALVCHLNKIPWAVMRTISDGANSASAGDFEAFLPQASKLSAKVIAAAVERIFDAEDTEC